MSMINNIIPVFIALDQRFITTLKIHTLDAHVVAKLAQKILNGVYVMWMAMDLFFFDSSQNVLYYVLKFSRFFYDKILFLWMMFIKNDK